ncbi:ABC transporter substrate-binding protein [Geomonas sp.]|uniref:ABC transporter substrate-binding protein n=1 Tax=Geomonas sp. TaxID=2651584 RepID=UPI002B47D4DC|nr:ABC transporter substrate-binding protein [Geomonas sp.]HJV34567.1 ABC transporter substrate-binding protein [Geomonas sp.]
MKQIALLIGLLILAATTGYAADDVIKIGMVNDQTGANKASGRGMKVGVEAWFKAVNEKGGVNGKKLQLIVVDDQFVPEKTVDGLLKLVDEQKIFAVVGGVGTPNCVASLPIVKEYKLPMINPRTGASELREPLVKEVIHIRASYKQEVDRIVDHLVQKGDKRFAVFYQNDAFGKDILNATEAAVKRHGLSVVSKGSFERNTTAVTGGLAAIMEGKPDAIIVGAVYAPGAAFIKLARKEGVKAHVAGGSWAGGSNLAKAVGDAADGLVMSQVVPELEDLSLPLTKECKEAIDKNPEEIGFNTVSLEGCEVAKSIVMALDKAGNPPTKEGFLNAYESMKDADLGGVKLSLSPTDHTAQDNVYLQSVQGGKLVPVKN